MSTYIALLRAINVAGRSKVPMAELRQVFAALGFGDVVTYIQSGNVVFSLKAATLDNTNVPSVQAIESALTESFGFQVSVMLFSTGEWDALVAENPFLTERNDISSLHVTFLAEEPDGELVGRLVVPPGVRDELHVRGKYVYLHCPDGYGRTKINNVFVERKLGIPATTRNWKTVLALHDLANK